MDLATVALVVAFAQLLLVGCLGYLLIRRYGELLLRLEALESRSERRAHRAAKQATGLLPKSVVQDFELPDLSGRQVRLSQWEGRRLLLIFFDPSCVFSRAMLPELAALPLDGSNRDPLPLIVSTGDPEENRRLFETHRIRWPVLLQDDHEVARQYSVGATPMGYLIDEQRRTVGTVATGPRAVLALAGALQEGPLQGNARATRGEQDQVTRLVAASPRRDDGLPAGTPAPGFRLPRLDGGELSLEEYRGRPVLLVFSDPACEPCDQLMPRLEQVHRRAPEPRVVLVSRGDPEAIRANVAEHGLTLPVVIQHRWETSRAYGPLATPIAYLIDELGIIAADVAVGAEAILALVDEWQARR
jgi:peroxiredoxin